MSQNDSMANHCIPAVSDAALDGSDREAIGSTHMPAIAREEVPCEAPPTCPDASQDRTAVLQAAIAEAAWWRSEADRAHAERSGLMLLVEHLRAQVEVLSRHDDGNENFKVGKIPCYVVKYDEEGRYLNQLRDPAAAATTKYFGKELRVRDQFNLLSCECWVSGEPSLFNSRDRVKSRLVRESDRQLAPVTLWISCQGTLVAMPFSTCHGHKEATADYSTVVIDVGDADRRPLDELMLLHILEYVAPSDGSAVGTFRFKCATRTRLEFSLLTVVQRSNLLILVDFPAEKKISPPIKSITQLVSGDIVLLIDPDLPGASLAARAYALKHYSVSVTVEKLNPVDETDRLATTMELQLLEDMTYEQVQHAIWEALGKPGEAQGFDPQRYGLRNHNVMNDAPTPHMQLPEKQERDDVWVGETLRTFLCFQNPIPVRKVYYEILPQELTAQRIGRETLWDFTCYVGRKALHFYWHPKDKAARAFVPTAPEMLKDFINTAAKAFHLPPERIRLLSLLDDGRLEQSSLHSASPAHCEMVWSFGNVTLDLLPIGVTHPRSYFGAPPSSRERGAREESESAGQLLIDVQHVYDGAYFGTPTVVQLRPEDTCGTVLDRIATHLGITAATERAGWRLLFRPSPMPIAASSSVTDGPDLWALVNTGLRNQRALLLEHPVASFRRLSSRR